MSDRHLHCLLVTGNTAQVIESAHTRCWHIRDYRFLSILIVADTTTVSANEVLQVDTLSNFHAKILKPLHVLLSIWLLYPLPAKLILHLLIPLLMIVLNLREGRNCRFGADGAAHEVGTAVPIVGLYHWLADHSLELKLLVFNNIVLICS